MDAILDIVQFQTLHREGASLLFVLMPLSGILAFALAWIAEAGLPKIGINGNLMLVGVFFVIFYMASFVWVHTQYTPDPAILTERCTQAADALATKKVGLEVAHHISMLEAWCGSEKILTALAQSRNHTP